jgi:hypothetical protein
MNNNRDFFTRNLDREPELNVPPLRTIVINALLAHNRLHISEGDERKQITILVDVNT